MAVVAGMGNRSVFPFDEVEIPPSEPGYGFLSPIMAPVDGIASQRSAEIGGRISQGHSILNPACSCARDRHRGRATALWFETCLIMRAEDSSRAVNEFARSFLRRLAHQVLPAKQMELPLPA
jgi:hypothetical protein